MQRLTGLFPIFLDATGRPMDGGKVYVGIAGDDPETDPITVYWDPELSIPADQPLRTIGGRIVNGASPSNVFVDALDYSLRVRTAGDVLVEYSASVYQDLDAFQPKDADLTAIAEQGTTTYGRALLNLADQDALKEAVGYAPFTGGTVSSDITRQAGGDYAYWADAALTSGRMFLTANGASDPTSQPGDVWFEASA